MELKEMNTKASLKKMNKIMESRFGFKIDYSKMTPEKATKMIATINESISKVKTSTASHKAQQDPKYMEMVMVKESLNKYMKDYKPANAPQQKASPKMQEIKTSVAKQTLSEMTTGRNRQMLTRVAELAAKGKPVPSKYMEGFVPLFKMLINESEAGTAEVILATKDVVDTMQDMIEDLSRMINEELPPLTDSIRDQVGSEQAEAYNAAANSALSGLLDSVKAARESMDSAARAVAGEQVDAPMAMPEPEAELPAPDLSDLDAEETDGFDAVDAAAGGEEELGREER